MLLGICVVCSNSLRDGLNHVLTVDKLLLSRFHRFCPLSKPLPPFCFPPVLLKWIISRWLEDQLKSNEKHALFILHSISSFEGS